MPIIGRNSTVIISGGIATLQWEPALNNIDTYAPVSGDKITAFYYYVPDTGQAGATNVPLAVYNISGSDALVGQGSVAIDGNSVGWYSVAANISLEPYVGSTLGVATARPVGGIGGARILWEASGRPQTTSNYLVNDPFIREATGGRTGSFYAEVTNIPTAPSINPTGTDTDLINGTSFDIVYSGLTSDPASVEVVWDNGVDAAISSTQADFSLGTVTDGVATSTQTATIGNLPYTDATYLTADYSYLVSCVDTSEITFNTLTISPATGSSFTTVASPVNDSTSILPTVTMANGDQLEWPDVTDTATLTVNANGSFGVEWSGAPANFTFTLYYWDQTEWFSIVTTINTAGEVVSGGLTRVGLTRIGLTSIGLTRVGLTRSVTGALMLMGSTYLTALTEMSQYG